MISEPGCRFFLDVCLRALSCCYSEQNDCALVEPEDQCAQDCLTLNSLIKVCLLRLQLSLERLVKHQSLAAGCFSHQRHFFVSEEKESKGKSAQRKSMWIMGTQLLI